MISLQDALYAQLAEREHPSGAGDRHAHASEAGRCARAIWYRIAGAEETNPRPLPSLIAMEIGTQLHAVVQAALRRQDPQLKAEVYWERGPVSGHADALYTTRHGGLVVAEIKTASPFAWGYMRTPKREHLLQASVNALGLEVDAVHLIYLNIAPRAGDESIREFHEPRDRPAATAEMDRLGAIALSPRLVPREFEGDTIEEPATTSWPCGYCPFRDRCLRDGR